MGVALLPRRCAESEIARGELIALPIPEIRLAAAGAPGVQARRRAVARLGRVSRLYRREDEKPLR